MYGVKIYTGDVVNVIDRGQKDWSHGVCNLENGCFYIHEAPMNEIEKFEVVGSIYDDSKIIHQL
jgi:hypothetical protein